MIALLALFSVSSAFLQSIFNTFFFLSMLRWQRKKQVECSLVRYSLFYFSYNIFFFPSIFSKKII